MKAVLHIVIQGSPFALPHPFLVHLLSHRPYAAPRQATDPSDHGVVRIAAISPGNMVLLRSPQRIFRKLCQLVTPGVLLFSGAAAASAVWPPPDNVLDDEAKDFVRVQRLHAGPFNISELYCRPA